MANYLTTDTDLTAVADAIRTKGGTSGQLVFPQGFVDAIDAIETGGGGYTLDEIASGSQPSGVIRITVSKIGNSAFRNNVNITRVEIPGTCDIGNSSFEYGAFTSFFAPNSTLTGNSCFTENKNVTAIVIGSANNKQYWGRYCTKLVAVDLSKTGTIAMQCLMGDTVLTTLILRPSSVVVLGSTNVFTNSPFASGKAGGTIYVPSALIESYQAATNWSTILGYGDGAQNQILPIEGSIYETQYADGTPIPTT